jgi:hypothetical protein
MITLLNNRVKRGSSDNVRVLFFNGFENKAKYGAGYGYGYGYGYGPYSMDILMRRNHGISMMQSRKLQTKGKKIIVGFLN